MGRSGRLRLLVGAIGAVLALSACGEGKPPAPASAPDPRAALLAVFPDAVNGEAKIPAAGDTLARVERPKAAIAGEAGRVYLVTAKELTDACHACSASVLSSGATHRVA